jgi:hypothetical protein
MRLSDVGLKESFSVNFLPRFELAVIVNLGSEAVMLAVFSLEVVSAINLGVCVLHGELWKLPGGKDGKVGFLTVISFGL